MSDQSSTRSLYPCLRYTDAPAAIEWLQSVLGFEVSARYDGDAGQVQHAELVLGSGMLMLGSARDDDLQLVPADPSGTTSACVYIAVDDIQDVAARIENAGWPLIRPLADVGHGEELTCRDPEGVIWSVGTYRP